MLTKVLVPFLIALMGCLLFSVALLNSGPATGAGPIWSYALTLPMVAADSAAGISSVAAILTTTNTVTNTPTVTSTSTPTRTPTRFGSHTATSATIQGGNQTTNKTPIAPTMPASISVTPTATMTDNPTSTPITPIPTTATLTMTPTVISTPMPTATPDFTPTSMPTPTPTVVACASSPLPESVTYFGTSGDFPKIVRIDINNFDGAVGQSQQVTVQGWGDSPIEAVDVVLHTDHEYSQTFGLHVVSQSVHSGIYKDVWTLSYMIQDTHECIYTYTFTVRQDNGQTKTSVLMVR